MSPLSTKTPLSGAKHSLVGHSIISGLQSGGYDPRIERYPIELGHLLVHKFLGGSSGVSDATSLCGALEARHLAKP